MYKTIDLFKSSPEIIFYKLYHFQNTYASHSKVQKHNILQDIIKRMETPIMKIIDHLQTQIQIAQPDLDIERFEEIFMNCLYLRSMTPLKSNSSWSDVYQPVQYQHLFRNNKMKEIEEHLHTFFYNDSITYNTTGFNSNNYNPFYDSMSNTSRLRFLSQRSQNVITDYYDNDICQKQNFMLLLGPKSSGKFTNLKVFALKCNYELEIIDFTLENKILSIKKKYLYAIATNDVKVNLMDQFKNNKKYQSRLKESAKSAKLSQFFKTKKSKSELTNEGDDSRIQRQLKKQGKRKIFVCKNVDFLYDINQFENKKKFVKQFSEFLKFIEKSKYPFVFISMNERKCSKIFGQIIDNMKIIEFESPNCMEFFQYLYCILFIERMFRLFDGKDRDILYTDFFSLKRNKQLVLKNSNHRFEDNIPIYKNVRKFVMLKGININWILEKAFLFKNYFFKSILNPFENKQLMVNYNKSNIFGLISMFPDKPKFLKFSFLKEHIKNIAHPEDANKIEDERQLTMYSPVKPKIRIKKPLKAKFSLSYSNPNRRIHKKKKSKNIKELTRLKNCLKLQVLTDNSNTYLSNQEEIFDHLLYQSKPNMDIKSDSNFMYKHIFNKRKSKTLMSIKKACEYYSNFEKDISEIDRIEEQIKIYNQMFNKQVPFAFLSSNRIRFNTFEIDLFKQVRDIISNELVSIDVINSGIVSIIENTNIN